MRISNLAFGSGKTASSGVPPKVSIGMPLYNGDQYLREALDCIRRQDFLDYEVIISDNSSTDSTAEICRRFAAENPRVHFHSQEKNIGAANNFSFVFEQAKAPYFMWFAHDDGWEPTYLRKCVSILDNHPSVVMCFSDVEFIDAGGRSFLFEDYCPIGYNKVDTFRKPLLERIRILIAETNWYAVYGMIRSDALRKTRKATLSFGWDVYLLMEILLLGETFILPEKLMRYRIIPKTSHQQLMETVNPDVAIMETPYTELARGLFNFLMEYDFGKDLKKEIQGIFIENFIRGNTHWRDTILTENFNKSDNASVEQMGGFLMRLFTIAP